MKLGGFAQLSSIFRSDLGYWVSKVEAGPSQYVIFQMRTIKLLLEATRRVQSNLQWVSKMKSYRRSSLLSPGGVTIVNTHYLRWREDGGKRRWLVSCDNNRKFFWIFLPLLPPSLPPFLPSRLQFTSCIYVTFNGFVKMLLLTSEGKIQWWGKNGEEFI